MGPYLLEFFFHKGILHFFYFSSIQFLKSFFFIDGFLRDNKLTKILHFNTTKAFNDDGAQAQNNILDEKSGEMILVLMQIQILIPLTVGVEHQACAKVNKIWFVLQTIEAENEKVDICEE